MKRTPLRRKTPMRRRRAEGADVEREPRPMARATPATRRGTYTGATSGQAVPKPEPVKPGKGTPTKDEAAWMDAIVRYGCIACRIDGRGFVPAAVHHILRGGRRIGHLHTLPLCDPGHHQNGQALGVTSRHPWKARFEQRYGSEDFLLARLRAEIGAIGRPTASA